MHPPHHTQRPSSLSLALHDPLHRQDPTTSPCACRVCVHERESNEFISGAFLGIARKHARRRELIWRYKAPRERGTIAISFYTLRATHINITWTLYRSIN
jgi:hypothetical protein